MMTRVFDRGMTQTRGCAGAVGIPHPEILRARLSLGPAGRDNGAILAARAGARYISPFIGRFDDISEDGLAQVADIVAAIGNYDFSASTVNGEQVEIIAASVRSALRIIDGSRMTP